jgi:hypothetical protein
MELEAVTSYCAMFYHKTKSLIPIMHSGIPEGRFDPVDLCMVRDIKKKMKIILLLKMFPNEIEVNLFIFPDIKITI